MSFDEMHDTLCDMLDKLPQDFFNNLNGGVNLSDEVKLNPASRQGDLYIMAQYYWGGQLGRYITVFYGSFVKVFGSCSDEYVRQKLWEILKHEFRHHLESLAGDHSLEYEDREYIDSYLERTADLPEKPGE